MSDVSDDDDLQTSGTMPKLNIRAYEIDDDDIVDLLATDSFKKPEIKESADNGTYVDVR